MQKIKLKTQYNILDRMKYSENKPREYCFNFAFKDSEISYCEEAYDILKHEYKKVLLKDSKKGDIISFHNKDYSTHHFAVISKTDGYIKNTHVHSKWGRLRVVKCKLLDIPREYGEYIFVWRKQ